MMFPAELHTAKTQTLLSSYVDPVMAAQGAQTALHYATYMQAADVLDNRRARWIKAAREGVHDAAIGLGMRTIDPNNPAAIRQFILEHGRKVGLVVIAPAEVAA